MTLRVRKTRRPSGTRARPRVTMRSAGIRVRSWPANSMAPFRGGSSPEMVRRVVVLPAPLPPIKVTTSPGRTWREMPLSTGKRPYPAWTLFRSACSVVSSQWSVVSLRRAMRATDYWLLITVSPLPLQKLQAQFAPAHDPFGPPDEQEHQEPAVDQFLVGVGLPQQFREDRQDHRPQHRARLWTPCPPAPPWPG